MNLFRSRVSSSIVSTMAEELGSSAYASTATSSSRAKTRSFWPSILRWIPTSTDHVIAAEKRLLSVVKTPYVVEQVNIGSGPPGSKTRWFRSKSDEPRFINTVTFQSKEDSPTLVMVHGYGASQGFFFRNFDALASRFKIIAIDQLGWGGSSRPDFTCKSTEETEAWFIDSFEEWRKAKNLSNFILLGHSFGGYVAAKYALKHPEHVQQLILVGSAGFSSESDSKSEWLTRFRATWKGAVLNHLWESNFTPQKVIRGLGPLGPDMVRRYTTARFGSYSSGEVLAGEECKLLTDYVYHTLAAKASGELCLKYIFSFGAFARKPLLQSAPEWKVPTTFIYGFQDWMNYEGAQQARQLMKVPCEIIRVPKAGHFVFIVSTMAEELGSSASTATSSSLAKTRSFWPSILRWIPTSTDHVIAAEKRLLSLVKTPYVVEQVNIGSGPPGSKTRWFRSKSDEPRFINTVTFQSKEDSPTLVMVHGYGASQGFFFRNFDALASRFKIIAIDQLGWGGSSRPDFTCKSTEETEAWFIDSFEEWRKAKNLSNFILLGHSFGGYVAAKYALKHPEHVQQLILVGPAGVSSESDSKSEWLTRFRATWKGAVLNHLWESNFTPQKAIRGLGPWGPDMVRRYTTARFGAYSTVGVLAGEECKLLTDYSYHTFAAKASGELCLKYIFSFGAFARKPLVQSAPEWKVPTTFIYGFHDWMNYEGAQQARQLMKVPCKIIRVPKAGHLQFIDNPTGFHSAVFYACRMYISPNLETEHLPEGLTLA
uniref:1-acylglycerol-3-phosphate O-acyltransferase n=1 Tax=Salix viminalis TaxID=40686 RepID=A0A6N2LCR4_SALVM